MAVALALLNVRTAVIAARDGGGGESIGAFVAVAAVSGARRVAHLGRRVVTRRAAARERQHTSGSMPNARRAMTRRPAAHRAAECLAAAAVAVVGGTAYRLQRRGVMGRRRCVKAVVARGVVRLCAHGGCVRKASGWRQTCHT